MRTRRALIILGVLGIIDVASGVAMQSDFGIISRLILVMLNPIIGTSSAASIAGFFNMVFDFGLFYLLIAWWIVKKKS